MNDEDMEISIQGSSILKELVSNNNNVTEDNQVGISSDDWKILIESLDTKATACKNAIQDALVGHLPDHIGTFTCAQESAVLLDNLRNDISNAFLQVSGKESLQANVIEHDMEHNKISAWLQQLDRSVGLLENLKLIQASLQRVDLFLEQVELRKAADECSMVDLNLDNITNSSNFEGDENSFVDSKVYKAVRVQLWRKKAKVRTCAQSVIEDLLLIKPQYIQVKIEDLEGEKSKLHKALSALDSLGYLKNILGSNTEGIGYNLWIDIFKPIIDEESMCQIEFKLKGSVKEMNIIKKSISKEKEVNFDFENKRKQAINLFSNIVSVFQFINRYVFDLDDNLNQINIPNTTLEGNINNTINKLNSDAGIKDDWLQYFQKSIWGGSIDDKGFECNIQNGNDMGSKNEIYKADCLFSAITHFLVILLPDDLNGLNVYQEIANKANLMENSLSKLGLFSLPNKNNNKNKNLKNIGTVNSFLSSIEDHIAKKRRVSLLSKVRHLILDDYFSSILISSCQDEINELFRIPINNELFQLKDMTVTNCAKEVLKLVIYSLNEGVQSVSIINKTTSNIDSADDNYKQDGHDKLAFIFYQTSRDMVELFRNLVPLVYDKELQNKDIGRTGILFHNDCLFLGHYMVFLGHFYTQKFGSAFSSNVVTVDMVPTLRKTAKKFLKLQIEIQADRISQLCFQKIKINENKNLSSLVAGLAQDNTDINDEDIITASDYFDEIVKRIPICIESFKRIQQEWEKLLSVDAYKKVIVPIGNRILNKFIDFMTLQDQLQEHLNYNNTSKSKILKIIQTPSPTEILNFRQNIQVFKDEITTPLVKLLSSSDGNIETDMPSIISITQICTVLEQYITMTIFKDMISQGSLSCLNDLQLKGLAKILLPEELY